MERINQYDFYELSRKLGALNQFSVDTSIDPSAAFWAAYWGQTNVTAMLNGEPIELGVSRVKAEELLSNINKLIQRHFTSWDENGKADWKFPTDGEQMLSAWEWSDIRSGLAEFELIFAEELREAATYRVPNRGIFNTRQLVDQAHCTFPKEIQGSVPEKTKLEWRAAGRCLAFGMFTACGFHVARAVEGTLEAYFHHYSGGPATKPMQWGEYLGALEKLAAAKPGNAPDKKTIGELRQLKDDWRNPLMHPRVVLAEADARTVYNNGETLIMMMGQELAAGAVDNAQPSLALVAPTGFRA